MFENKSISEIISLIQSKQVLVKEVVEFYLQRIKNFNPKLNAIVLLKEEEKILDEANLKDQDINKSKSLNVLNKVTPLGLSTTSVAKTLLL